MLMLQCPGCMTQAFTDCTCPPGHTANTGRHHPECSHSNLDAQLSCSCCPVDHDHGAAANACPGDHAGAACPDAADCRIWKGAIADAFSPGYTGDHPLMAGHDPGDPVPDCPGGHCHKDVPGCTVCRPMVITLLPGSTEITLAGQAA